MNTFEIISDGHSEFISGSTSHQVALAISRERCVFETLRVQDMKSGRETIINGTTILSLAYLDNHYQKDDDEWRLKE